MPNNGVEVGGVRVLLRTEYRRIAWLRSLLVSLLQWFPAAWEQEWHVLTVLDSSGTVLAQRRCTSDREARAARERFVESVPSDLHDGDTHSGRWQVLLDRA